MVGGGGRGVGRGSFTFLYPALLALLFHWWSEVPSRGGVRGDSPYEKLPALQRCHLSALSKCCFITTQTSGIVVKQVVFHTVNHRGPLPLRELHSTGETIVWRDPGGSWACLLPVYDCVWNHPATGWDIRTTPKKHTKKRETLRNANQNKTTRRAGYKKVNDPPPPPPPHHASIQN